jgi:hypothetical protein
MRSLRSLTGTMIRLLAWLAARRLCSQPGDPEKTMPFKEPIAPNHRRRIRCCGTIVVAVLAFGCYFPGRAVTSGTYSPAAKQFDINVESAHLLGMAIGMTPRRVAAVIAENRWIYCATSRYTVDDLVYQKPFVADICLELTPKDRGDPFARHDTVEIGFACKDHCDTPSVIDLSHTYEISVADYPTAVEEAKNHLAGLGSVQERITEGSQFEHRLTYQKVERSYITYSFIRFSKESTEYSVHYRISSY